MLVYHDTISGMTSHIYSNTKNQLATALLLALITLFALPHPAAALSCLNPSEMIEQYASEDEYTVALIAAGTIETTGNEHDQSVTTKTLYKGELGTTDTVTFAFDKTWNYLCSGGPAEEGTEAVYVLSDKQVVQVFATDSELAKNLLAAIDTPAITPTEVPAEEAEKKSLMQRIITLLQQIISLIAPDAEVVAPNTDYVDLSTIESENPIIQEPQVTEPGTHDVIIGLTTGEAEAYAETTGVAFRIGMIDGESLPVTMDYRIGRITAEVEKDVVTGYSVE